MTPGQQMFTTIFVAFLGSGMINIIVNRIFSKKDATTEALQCLLRDRILQSCRYHVEKGWCDTDDKTNIEKMYHVYEKLGGNDVAHKAYDDLMQLPAFPPKEAN